MPFPMEVVSSEAPLINTSAQNEWILVVGDAASLSFVYEHIVFINFRNDLCCFRSVIGAVAQEFNKNPPQPHPIYFIKLRLFI